MRCCQTGGGVGVWAFSIVCRWARTEKIKRQWVLKRLEEETTRKPRKINEAQLKIAQNHNQNAHKSVVRHSQGQGREDKGD